MITLRLGLTGGTASLCALLAAVGTTVEMGVSAWGVGLACGALLLLAVARGVGAAGRALLGPADLVTLIRALLACVLAAVVVAASPASSSRPVLVTLAVVALLLDAVDGPVARITRTTSAFGARFDGEADAFLIMVLSVYVAPSVGLWVLAIGAARYVYGAAGWWLPWLRVPLPPRYWRKVVAAAQGVALTGAAAGVAPPTVVALSLAVALALLAESFGRDVLWAWRRRAVAAGGGVPVLPPTVAVSGPRR